jgi:hypothetical protein
MNNCSNGTQESKHQIAFELLYADGEWFRLPKWLHRIRPKGNRLKTAAYTLAALLNQSSMKKAVLKNKGWFDFSQQKAEDETGFPPDCQNGHLTTLEDYGLVRRRRASRPCGRRQVKILYKTLVDLIYEAAKERLTENPVNGKPVKRLTENPLSGYRKKRQPNTKEDTKEGTKARTRPPLRGDGKARPPEGFLAGSSKHACSPENHQRALDLHHKLSGKQLLGSKKSDMYEWGSWLDKADRWFVEQKYPGTFAHFFEFHLDQLGEAGHPEAFCGRSVWEKRDAIIYAWNRYKKKRAERNGRGRTIDREGNQYRWDEDPEQAEEPSTWHGSKEW